MPLARAVNAETAILEAATMATQAQVEDDDEGAIRATTAQRKTKSAEATCNAREVRTARLELLAVLALAYELDMRL